MRYQFHLSGFINTNGTVTAKLFFDDDYNLIYIYSFNNPYLIFIIFNYLKLDLFHYTSSNNKHGTVIIYYQFINKKY